MRRIILLMLFVSLVHFVSSQGYNHTWLLSYGNWQNKARINFTSITHQLNIEQRNMGFEGTQGNISDVNGNLLFSSNGVWIANKSNTMMLNGGGLNPNTFTNDWSSGLPIANGNIFLPIPNDSTKYILFHQTANYNYNLASSEIYYSVIDITGDNGDGEVIQKNSVLIQDTLAWGMAACKHANGRDWWVIAISDKSNIVYKFLLTSLGIQNYGIQQFNFPIYEIIVTQPTFSQDGSKFAFTAGKGVTTNYWLHDLRILNFDRCSGNFSNPQLVDLIDGVAGFGVAFSPNSNYLYVSKFDKILQLNTDTTDIAASLDTVAIYDGFYSPYPPFATDFWYMYLAANGKIYITSGNSVQHIHYIDNPDLDGIACDVVQHGLDLNGIWHFRAVPTHPNYYLGAVVGSICDSLGVGINEVEHDFKFNIFPNPSSGNFNIIYLLPHTSTGSASEEGKLEIFDITGKVVYEMRLPQWSTLQQIRLPTYISNGIYNCVITAGNHRTSKKIAILKN